MPRLSVANEMWPLAEEIRGLRAVANVYSVQDLSDLSGVPCEGFECSATDDAPQSTAPTLIIWRRIVKALIWAGHCNRFVHTVRDRRARSGWRPALIIVTSGFASLWPPQWRGRSSGFSPRPTLGREPREPLPRSGVGGTSRGRTLRGLHTDIGTIFEGPNESCRNRTTT